MQSTYLTYIKQFQNTQHVAYLLVGEVVLTLGTLDGLIKTYQTNGFNIEKYIADECPNIECSQNLSLFAQKRLLIFYCNKKDQLKTIAPLLEHANEQTHLIALFHDYKTTDKKQKWFKDFDKKGMVIQHFKLKNREILTYLNTQSAHLGIQLSAKESADILENASDDLLSINNLLMQLKIVGEDNKQRQLSLQNNLVNYDIYQLIFLFFTQNFKSLSTAFASMQKNNPPAYFLSIFTQEIAQIIQLAQLPLNEREHYFQSHRLFGERKQQKLAATQHFSPTQLSTLYQQLCLLSFKQYQTNTDAFWEKIWQTITSPIQPLSKSMAHK